MEFVDDAGTVVSEENAFAIHFFYHEYTADPLDRGEVGFVFEVESRDLQRFYPFFLLSSDGNIPHRAAFTASGTTPRLIRVV